MTWPRGGRPRKTKMVLEPLQAGIRRLLKVPPEPDPPLGDPASVRVFRAAPGFLRYRLLGWGWKQIGALVGLLFGLYLVFTSLLFFIGTVLFTRLSAKQAAAAGE